MGCCFSTSKSKLSTSILQKQQHSLVGIEKPRSDPKESRASRPSIEEETVKEVLSETPKALQLPQIPLKAETIREVEQLELKDEQKRTHKPVFEINNKQGKVKPLTKQPIINQTEDISEVSEIFSLSESVSTATNFTRKDDNEVQQRVNRSPMKLPKRRNFSGDIGQKRERVVGRRPNRRSDQSPVRRNGVGSVRMCQSREPSQPMVRRLLRTEPLWRDPGEISAGRSSPATRANLDRSSSARRSGKSPGRTTTAPIDVFRKTVEEPSIEYKWPTNTSSNESLENPLVSLECFIFL